MKQSTVSKTHTQNDVYFITALGIFALLITTGLHIISVPPTFIRCALSLIAATVAFVWTYLHFTEDDSRDISIGVVCAFLATGMDIIYLTGLFILATRF